MDYRHRNSLELTPDLGSVLDDLQKSDHEAQRIATALSDTQANWQPREASWSVAQCLDHLGRANKVYAQALHQAVRETRVAKKSQSGPIEPGWFGRYFIRSLEPPPKRKLPAPKKIVPLSRISCHKALDEFLRSHEDVRAVIRDAAGLDLNRIRFHNPFIGVLRFTVGTGLLIITAHDRRHLWQAESVLGCPGFPES